MPADGPPGSMPTASGFGEDVSSSPEPTAAGTEKGKRQEAMPSRHTQSGGCATIS